MDNSSITQASPVVNEQRPTSTNNSTSNKTLLYVLIAALLLLVLVLGGILAYMVLTKDVYNDKDKTNDDDSVVSICTYDSVVYYEGDTFPATDGCNTCTCESGNVSCTEMGCDGEGNETDEAQYNSTTRTCVVSAGNVTVELMSEYPVGVTVTPVDGSDRCTNTFTYGNSTLEIGYNWGEYFGIQYGSDNSENVASSYLNSVIRVTWDNQGTYLYGIPAGNNNCYQKPADDPCNVYFGNDKPYLFNPGLVENGVAEALVSVSDDKEDVLQVFDYIIGHSTVVIK